MNILFSSTKNIILGVYDISHFHKFGSDKAMNKCSIFEVLFKINGITCYYLKKILLLIKFFSS